MFQLFGVYCIGFKRIIFTSRILLRGVQGANLVLQLGWHSAGLGFRV